MVRYMTGQAANGAAGGQDPVKKMRGLGHTDFMFQTQDPPSSHTRRLLEHVSCRRKRSKRQCGRSAKSEIRNPKSERHGTTPPSAFGIRIYFVLRTSALGLRSSDYGPRTTRSPPSPRASYPSAPSTMPPIRKSRRESA